MANTGMNLAGYMTGAGMPAIPQRYNSVSTPSISIPKTTISGFRTVTIINGTPIKGESTTPPDTLMSKPRSTSSKKSK